MHLPEWEQGRTEAAVQDPSISWDKRDWETPGAAPEKKTFSTIHPHHVHPPELGAAWPSAASSGDA